MAVNSQLQQVLPLLAGEQFVEDHLAEVDNAAWKKGFKLMWVGVGKQDSMAYQDTQDMMTLLKAHGVKLEYYENGNGHTWISWRDYLVQCVEAFPVGRTASAARRRWRWQRLAVAA